MLDQRYQLCIAKYVDFENIHVLCGVFVRMQQQLSTKCLYISNDYTGDQREVLNPVVI